MNFKNLYTPSKTLYSDSQNYHRDPNMFVSLTLLTQIINILFCILYIAQEKWTSFYIVTISIILMTVNGIYFKKTANFRNSFALYSLIVLSIISFDHMIEPSYNGSNLFWYAPCLFSAFYLLDKARAYVVASVGFLLFTGAYLYKFSHIIPASINSTTPEQGLVINITTMFLTTAAIYLISRFFFEEERLIKDRLRELSASNATLISILTHDLSTPTMLASLSLKKSRESEKDYQIVERALKKITNIVNDTRELHALGTGKKEIKLSLQRVDQILERTVLDYAYIAEKKDVNLVIENSLSKETTILTDPKSFQNNVLSNLISNAVKFSRSGDEVILRTTECEKNITISICDNGVGISKEIQAHLFDFSVPTSQIGTLGEMGTGFGMPIVKMFMDIYQATIHVTSLTEEDHIDHGTTFELIFQKN